MQQFIKLNRVSCWWQLTYRNSRRQKTVRVEWLGSTWTD